VGFSCCPRHLNTARMPYTPPSQISPSTSQHSSPTLSRSHSYTKANLSIETSTASRSGFPRPTSSSSYLSKHRRSPSLPNNQDWKQSGDINGLGSDDAFEVNGGIDPHGSIRQSPPPVNNLLIPTGATISPPDSSPNSSDEEDISRGRVRELENLAELKAAIRTIKQRKESSPNRNDDHIQKARMALEGTSEVHDDHPNAPPTSTDSSRPPLSREARKISHSRSNTDSNIVFDASQHMPPEMHHQKHDDDDDDEDSDGRSRPAMVRKKSGELVRPALRTPSAKRRPTSMPGTPTYGKAVHFDSHLEHVRHFLQVDRPLAVSARSSPVDNYDGDMEFPFSGDDEKDSRSPYEWQIRLSNFPAETEERKVMPVHVERVYLSSDNKLLMGSIAVQNLAFQKLVVARYTLDYWKTTSEVVADFNNDVRRKHNDGLDHFTFSIKLADQAHLENKTMFFCIRYNVNGQEYWDNNHSTNYQVDFTKKVKSQNDKSSLGALPRSRPSPPTSGRPVSMPITFDDFSAGKFDNFGTFSQSPASIIGEPPIKLRAPRPRANMIPDAPTRRHKAKGPAFGNRYDFGASLNAAIQNAAAVLGEQSGLVAGPDTKQSSHEVPARKGVAVASTLENGVRAPKLGQVFHTLSAAPLSSSKPVAALVSEKPPLQSQSYQELVDKYCFVGTRAKRGK
jgi:Carbohydrate/starch-binding module (family 21)